MTRRALVGLSILVAAGVVPVFAGCSDDAAPASPPASVAPDAAAPTDELVTADADCAAGTRAAVGTTACAPVGTTTCAEGFTKDPSGWGCAAIVPADACTDATRPALGETACVPVGDCTGAFPPANAIVVDPALMDAELDATHVRTLEDALAGASSGATIALVDGEHAAPFLGVTKDVTIVGRCAAKAKLVPDGGGTGGMRITANATVKSVTIAGMDTVFEIYGISSSLDLEDAVLEASKARGVFVRNGAHARLKRSVVRGTVARSAGDQTIALFAGSGGVLEVEDSAVVDSFDAAIAATDEDATRITVKRSIVDGSTAGAIRAFEGAHVDVVESLVRRAGGMAVLALHRKGGYPEVTLTRSVVSDTIPTIAAGDEIATAINAAYGAIVSLDDTTVADTKGVAIYVAEAAKVTLTKSVVTRVRSNAQSSGNGASATHGGELALVDSAIVDATALGVGAFTGGHVKLERSLVRGIGGAVVNGLSIGFGLNATEQSTIDLTDSAVVDAREIDAALTDDGTRLSLDKVLFAKTEGAEAGEYGHGVLAAYGAVADVRGSIFDRHSGVALFYAGGRGTVSASLVRRNGVGAHVQEGSVLVEAESPPDEASDLELVVARDVTFAENASKTGTGELPLPTFAKGE